jgi:hypothetical protein
LPHNQPPYYLFTEGPAGCSLIYIKQFCHTLVSYIACLKLSASLYRPAFMHTQSLCFLNNSSLHLSSSSSSSLFMAFFLFLLLILMVPSSNAQWPPSPGYWPSSKFTSMSFYKGYRNLWGPSHQRFDQNALTIWLDRTSGPTHSHLHYNVYFSFYKPGTRSFAPTRARNTMQSALSLIYFLVFNNRKRVQVSTPVSIRVFWGLH